MLMVYLLLMCASFYSLHGYDQIKGPPLNNEVVKRIKNYLPQRPIIVEAGTYDGSDTIELRHLLPAAEIFTFEPVPELYNKSQAKLKLYPRIYTFNVALSDYTGMATMFLSEERNQPSVVSMSSSLLAPKEHINYAPTTLFKKKIEVPTITLDEWAMQNNISQVDFLKLDIQGFELNVMQASPKILKTVKVLLTEVEFIEAYKGQYLFEDIKKWLEQEGFELNCLFINSWFGDALFIRK